MFLTKSKVGFQTGSHARCGSHQHGFVLILALVMLTVLTLIGVSSMKSASTELKAAANAQQHIVAFNGTQSVLEFVTSRPAEGVINWTSRADLVQIATLPSLPGTDNLIVNVTYVGCSKGIGSSLKAGKGFSYSFFSVAGSGTNVTGTSTSLQSQGVRYPAASC